MGHTINEVMSMDKKFIAAVIVCVIALTAVATGTYFIGQKADKNVVNLKEAKNTVTTANENTEEGSHGEAGRICLLRRGQHADRAAADEARRGAGCSEGHGL